MHRLALDCSVCLKINKLPMMHGNLSHYLCAAKSIIQYLQFVLMGSPGKAADGKVFIGTLNVGVARWLATPVSSAKVGQTY